MKKSLTLSDLKHCSCGKLAVYDIRLQKEGKPVYVCPKCFVHKTLNYGYKLYGSAQNAK